MILLDDFNLLNEMETHRLKLKEEGKKLFKEPKKDGDNSGNWIKLYRKIIKNQFLMDDPEACTFFLFLLCRASYADTIYKGIKLKPGQGIIGKKSACRTFKWMTPEKYRQIKKRLDRNQFTTHDTTPSTTHDTTPSCTVFTILNFAKYQALNKRVQHPTQHPTQHGLQPDHNTIQEDVKKIKKVYNPPTPQGNREEEDNFQFPDNINPANKNWKPGMIWEL